MNIILALLLLMPANYYKLNGIKRLDADLYKTTDGLYVKTLNCYHYTYGEDATLRWDGPYNPENKVIWADGTTCEAKGVWK